MADYDGTPGNDKLTYPEHGTKDNDVYYGYEGNDTLDGGPGADVMYGGPSADHLHGDDINSETAAGTEVRVTVSGDAYQGQPEMRVLLGNEEIGRVHVTARHDIGEWQVLTFTAPGVVDAKQLRLEFVEDAYDEGIGDRNLWVAKVEANGKVFDALAGRLDPPQWSGDPEHAVLQEHGYVLPSKGALQFSLPPGNQQVATGGPDRLHGGEGDDVLYGDGRMDVAVFEGNRNGYEIDFGSDGGVSVTDIDPADGDDGVDVLYNIRWAKFEDRTVQLDGISAAQALAKSPIESAFYVAPEPDGNDNNPGTLDQPFATLKHARDSMSADLSIKTTYVLGGDHWLADEPLALGEEDSGVRFIGIAGPDGPKPILHGGKLIQGFEREQGDIWTSKTSEEVYLDLTIDGERVWPAIHGNLDPSKPLDWRIGGPASKEYEDAADAISVKASEFPQNVNEIPSGTYVQVFRHHWRWFDDIVTAKGLQDTDEPGRLDLTLDSDPEIWTKKDGVVYRLLARPEFVGDGTNDANISEFGWSPETGLRMSSSVQPQNVVAAQRYSIVTLEGADNVILHGLTFSDTLTPYKAAENYGDDVAKYNGSDWRKQAAISVHDSDNLMITGNDFSNVGRAMNLQDSSAAHILGNRLIDLGRRRH